MSGLAPGIHVLLCVASRRGWPGQVYGPATSPTGVRGHHRHIIAGMDSVREAVHALARGVGDGSAAGVCGTGDAGGSEPAGALPAVRDPSGHRVQVAWPLGRRRGAGGSFAASSCQPAADGRRRSKRGSWRYAMPIRPGARARSRAVSSARACRARRVSTVHEILRRHGRIVAPPGGGAAQQRFEKAAPNLLWQMDFKGWVALADGSRCHPLTILDDHSRFDLCLEACANEQGGTVRARLERTFCRYGLPEAFFVDNGGPWGCIRGAALDGSERVAAQTRHRGNAQPALSPAEPRQERALPPYAEGRSVWRSGASAISPRRSAPSTPGARSTTSIARTRRSIRMCRRAAIGRAHAPCRIACRRSSTTCGEIVRDCLDDQGLCQLQRPPVESTAGLPRRTRRHPPAISRRHLRRLLRSSPDRNNRLDQQPKVSAMSPNRCRSCLRAKQQARP